MSPLERFESKFVKPKEGRTLVVGSRLFSHREDRRKRYADAVGIDMEPGAGVDVVLDLEEPTPEWLGTFAHIDLLSTLEHSRRPWLMAANLEKLLEPDGTIYVTVPWVWRLHSYPSDYWRMNPGAVRHLFSEIEWSAMRIATDTDLWPEDQKKIPAVMQGDVPFIQRAETCAFGRRRSNASSLSGDGEGRQLENTWRAAIGGNASQGDAAAIAD